MILFSLFSHFKGPGTSFRPSLWAKWELVTTYSSDLRTSTVKWVHELNISSFGKRVENQPTEVCYLPVYKIGLPIAKQILSIRLLSHSLQSADAVTNGVAADRTLHISGRQFNLIYV